MDRFRMIQPRHMPQHQYLQIQPNEQVTVTDEAGSEVRSRSKRKTRQRHTEAEWDAIRPDLVELLLTHSLVDAIEKIKQTHHFEAGLRAYRNKIAGWGLKQHQSAEGLGIVVAKIDKREREGINTVVIARGEQLATERLILFQRRAKEKQSPSAATPHSIEYYTPANNGRTPDAVQTPAGLTGTLLHKGLQDPTPENKEQRDLCKWLLMMDQTTQPVVVLQPVQSPGRQTDTDTETDTDTDYDAEPAEASAQATASSRRHLGIMKAQMTPRTQVEALSTQSQVPQRPIHDLHQIGYIAIVGRGRFAKKEKPLRLLWEMKKLCRDMHRAVYHATTSGKATISGLESITTDRISYTVRFRGKSAGIQAKRQGLLNFCQQNAQIHSILGLTKQDRLRWLQPWSEVVEDDASLVVQTANHLFGDLTSSYPEMDILEVLVHLHTTAPRREPILLRAAAGWDPGEERSKCLYCSDAFQIVDFMGSSGAVRLHFSDANSTEMLAPFSTFDSFRDAFADCQETVYPSWSEVAYKFQGWRYARLLRRCPCESKTHKNLCSEHYVDVFEEQTAEAETFDPEASSFMRVPFEPFPTEDRTNIVFGSNARKRPAEETWDPSGKEDSEDEFEPYPEAEHELVSDTRALKFRAL